GVDITVNVPCAAGAYAWKLKVKQSNDFNGPPGNDFTAVAPQQLTTTVASAALDHFGFAAIATPQHAGTPFNAVVTAYDACGNVKTDYAGTPTLSGNLGFTGIASPTYGTFTAGSWSAGTASAQVTAVAAETNRSLTVTDGPTGKTGTSGLFDV